MAEARCVALFRDERKGRLLVRYRACLGDDFTVVSGVLGLRPCEGSGDDLSKVTKVILTDFCTPHQGLLRNCALPDQENVDPASLEIEIRKKVTMVVSDAAAAELVSGDILRGRRAYACSGQLQADFPNIRIVGRDIAHASTRLLKRPLCHHETLKSLTSEFVTASDSFCQKVFHSNVFKGWWAEALLHKEDEEFTTGSSISAAKHRFSSYALPLGRLCRNSVAMVAVCQRIDAMRGENALWAGKLLRNLTGRKMLLLSVCADAAHTSLDFTRFADEESSDIAQLNQEADKFCRTIRTLFVDGRVTELPTFTKDMIDTLQRGDLTVMLDRCPREIRITQEDKVYALKVMQEWAVAAEASVESEFPSWHLLSCFSVFNLQSRRDSRQQDSSTVRACLRKLAKAFNVCPEALQKQYVGLLPVAEALHKQGSMVNRAAWTEAIRRTVSRQKVRERHAPKELSEAGFL